VRTQKVLHLIKQEELIFLATRERHLNDQGCDHSASGWFYNIQTTHKCKLRLDKRARNYSYKILKHWQKGTTTLFMNQRPTSYYRICYLFKSGLLFDGNVCNAQYVFHCCEHRLPIDSCKPYKINICSSIKAKHFTATI